MDGFQYTGVNELADQLSLTYLVTGTSIIIAKNSLLEYICPINGYTGDDGALKIMDTANRSKRKQAHAQRIMIIRHAEKPYDDGREQNDGVRMDGSKSNESLAVRGWQRAGALSFLLGSPEIAQSRGLSVPQVLYASDPEKADKIGSKSRRPKQTLIPLAQRLDLIIKAGWTKGQEVKLVRDVLKQTGIVLISWQHELIPKIAAAIPGGDIPQTRTWDDKRFDLIWVFDLLPDGTYAFNEFHQDLLSDDLGF